MNTPVAFLRVLPKGADTWGEVKWGDGKALMEMAPGEYWLWAHPPINVLPTCGEVKVTLHDPAHDLPPEMVGQIPIEAGEASTLLHDAGMPSSVGNGIDFKQQVQRLSRLNDEANSLSIEVCGIMEPIARAYGLVFDDIVDVRESSTDVFFILRDRDRRHWKQALPQSAVYADDPIAAAKALRGKGSTARMVP